MTSSGKTYLCNALCVSAIQQFKTVRYIRANILMLELEQARLQTTYLDYVSSLAKLDLLAIDDFGLMDLDLDKCRDLFEVIDGRDGRKSTIIVSQFPIHTWFDLFQEHTYADACLARITDKRHSYTHATAYFASMVRLFRFSGLPVRFKRSEIIGEAAKLVCVADKEAIRCTNT